MKTKLELAAAVSIVLWLVFLLISLVRTSSVVNLDMDQISESVGAELK